MNELALFAGAGGGILGGKLLGWRTVCAVEREPYAAGVLIQRQNDGILPPFPIWDDVCTFDGKPWRGIVDVVSGGFPCQDISTAGKGAGLDGARSGLWGEMARIIGEVRPRYAFIENSPMLTLRGLDRVLCDLAAMGFDARWGVVSAADAGAPHLRERIWIVANAEGTRTGKDFGGLRERIEGVDRGQNSNTKMADTNPNDWAALSTYTGVIPEGNGSIHEGSGSPVITGDCGSSDVADTLRPRTGRESNPRQSINAVECGSGWEGYRDSTWWQAEPDVGRVADGVAARVDRLKAIGNGQVPAVVKLAWETLSGHS